MLEPVQHLPALPVELWLRCWQNISRRQLRRLSLVCRLFRLLCLPLLIERQSAPIAALAEGYDRRNWVDRTHRLHRVAVRLDRLAGQGDSHVLAVRHWTISAPPTLQPRAVPPPPHTPDNLEMFKLLGIPPADLFEELRERIVSKFFATLGVYQNLRSLHLQRMVVGKNVREILASLVNLEELTLDNCDITPSDGILLPLQRLTLRATGEESGGDHPLRIARPETLTHLNLHAVAQTKSLLDGFAHTSFPRLRHLSFHPMLDVEDLLSLLERCSRLQSLEFPSDWTTAFDPPPIPELGTLQAPWDLAPAFASYPLHTITVLPHQAPIAIEDLSTMLFARCHRQHTQLELDDGTAFDDIPADEISDIEEEDDLWGRKLKRSKKLWSNYMGEEEPLPATPTGTYGDFLRRVALNLVDLPPRLAALEMTLPKFPKERHWSYDAQEEAAVQAMAKRGLREVTLGYNVWKVVRGQVGKVQRG
ncbi:hypothetical protein FB45DRAFT_1059545 [Roridomyces roridus]|uniref:F-box domain-containing protein n=1 Tax=Roridomyces roridus TaxID=1738132 RepID=A0AAD7BS27_9AGAR|nr:hypothetical protein FB45DRAFT_1059545 [Roridomyces roridus]